MLATSHGFLCELSMVVGTGADDHELDFCVCEEVVGRTVVLCFGIVDGTVLSRLGASFVRGSFCALQESVYLKISIWCDERQMKAFCGKAVAHKPDFDWRHGES